MLHAFGADYAAIVGVQEVAAGMVTLRDMQTGEQEMIGIDDAVFYGSWMAERAIITR